jgi:hypothetical protein
MSTAQVGWNRLTWNSGAWNTSPDALANVNWSTTTNRCRFWWLLERR